MKRGISSPSRSGRSGYRITATAADLAGSERMNVDHLSEAVQYHESNQPSISLARHLTLTAGVVSVATLCRSRR
jgi:hypothetical protein